MAPSIPTCEPDILYAGDTYKFTKQINDYPSSDGWTLTYSFRGPTNLPDITATVSGSGYAITIASAATALLAPGTYGWAARVTKSGETYTVGWGTLTVALVSNAVETVWEESVLAALKASYAGRATADMEQYTINGRSVTKTKGTELLKMIAKFEWRVWKLRNPGKIGVPVKTGFSAPDGTIGTPEPVSLPPYYRTGGG